MPTSRPLTRQEREQLATTAAALSGPQWLSGHMEGDITAQQNAAYVGRVKKLLMRYEATVCAAEVQLAAQRALLQHALTHLAPRSMPPFTNEGGDWTVRQIRNYLAATEEPTDAD
jgi:hypothetical protein